MASASYQHAQDLVEYFPKEAIWLIAIKCNYQDIVETLTQARNRERRKPLSNGSDYQTHEHALATSPVDSQSSISPPNNQRFRPRTPQTTRPALPPSPAPTSSSTGKSPFAKAQPEYVAVIVDGPPNDQEQKLSMKIASVVHSLISENIVRTRLWGRVNVKPILNGPIQLQCPAVSGGFLPSSHQVTLTWRRT